MVARDALECQVISREFAALLYKFHKREETHMVTWVTWVTWDNTVRWFTSNSYI